MKFRKENYHGEHSVHGEVKNDETVSRKNLSIHRVSPCSPCPLWFKLFFQSLSAVFAVVNWSH
jgi:hypothetical protein